ncbi:uncharacterized protein EDB91DRAFT_1062933 [Suillus paluster]|uniref:uncharacterized protein n=1 Tax=Suillus paluster TaxID=48578 RepID=UPI001B883B32|nr:uncharacterized protein EDB91DRAFT_1062933 [Suillus paluster]KAG1724231.1 hypothetical protein EDB91DRAFT_1062933 [Suillus paluster]
MNISNDTTPTGGVRAVTTFHNGSIAVELDSENLATWLRDLVGRPALAAQLGPSVLFHSHTFALVIEYLPIQMQIDSDRFLRDIEKENDLLEDSLPSIRWIKLLTRRTQE